MDYIKVKISNSFPHEPLLRQTPGSKGIWGNCQFFLNENIQECDYWIVYQGLTKEERTKCPPENVILITGEPPSLYRFKPGYLKQFNTVITCHRNINHPNVIHMEQGLPWHIGLIKGKNKNIKLSKDYDQLLAHKEYQKDKLLSVICSSKARSEGHRNRLKFVRAISDYFGNKIDVFGRGIRDIDDKWNAIADYKYHIAIENSIHTDYWTEKITDTFLGGAYPIYCGCPNLSDYFDADVFTAIDIHDVQKSIKIIEECIENNLYEKSIEKIAAAKMMVLDKYNLFAIIDDFIRSNRNAVTSEKQVIKLNPQAK
ncbi:glycosyltransferase family 10 domain-containing protein [Neobacillus kokaensis]|uniref:Fucosyltransferase C-terminal domain-containing protein n=1 Tax=Neobacillus kokaensis TaxID=2759023 RepID=A0ABQ3MZF2_9BACI|nr:glycosyltransferase family 10 [Neobacillus kokaensis]GHH98048.1 hypothetical protein AM1BK_15910 [Neobacillus kokaensis]